MSPPPETAAVLGRGAVPKPSSRGFAGSRPRFALGAAPALALVAAIGLTLIASATTPPASNTPAAQPCSGWVCC